MGITTSSPYGRGQVAIPDLGHEGGASLHTKVTSAFASLSNQQDSRWTGEVTLANTATETVTHNFGMALEDLHVRIYESGSLLSLEDQEKNYTIAEVDTDTISITNNSGGSKTFFAYVWGFNINRLLGRYVGRVETTDATPTTVATVPLRTDESAMMSAIICGRKNGTTAVAYRIEVLAENNAGTVTVTEIVRNELEDIAYTANLVASGENVIVQVSGEAATTVEWYAKVETTYV